MLHLTLPLTSNLYIRKVGAGDFPIVNQYLYNDLNELGLWKKDIVDEIIGNSSNKEDWKILEYKNHNLEKDYTKLYDNIKLDVNYDIINKIEDKKYLVDK